MTSLLRGLGSSGAPSGPTSGAPTTTSTGISGVPDQPHRDELNRAIHAQGQQQIAAALSKLAVEVCAEPCMKKGALKHECAETVLVMLFWLDVVVTMS